MKEKTRDSNVELIRIIAMFLVILTHCIMHTNLINSEGISTTNYIILQFISTITVIPNSLFILISGYYTVNSRFKLKKVLSLWGKVFLYTLIIYLIYFIIGKQNYFYESFFPIFSGQYWFITAYIALYLMSPIINSVIKKLTKNQFKYLLVLLTIFYGVIKVTFNPAGIFDGAFIPVIYIYLIGAYIRLYVEVKREKSYYFLKYIIFTILVTWLRIMIDSISFNHIVLMRLVYNLQEGLHQFSNILLVLSVVFLFMKFKTISIQKETINRVILFISPSIFPIYIIHENINNRWLWTAVINPVQYNNSSFLIVYIILAIICVFIVCLMIDIIRRGTYRLIKKNTFIDKFINVLNKKIDNVNEKLNDYLS